MRRTTLEFVAYSVFSALVIVGLFLTSRIDLAFSKDLIGPSGPRAYPAMVFGGLLVMCGVLLIRSFRAMREDRQAGMAEFDPPTAVKVTAVFAAALVFAMTFEPLGYLLTVPAIMLFIAFVSGGRRWAPMLITSAAMALICLLVFRYGLNTVLPEGLIGIDAIL